MWAILPNRIYDIKCIEDYSDGIMLGLLAQRLQVSYSTRVPQDFLTMMWAKAEAAS
jgi:hypothetical protein